MVRRMGGECSKRGVVGGTWEVRSVELSVVTAEVFWPASSAVIDGQDDHTRLFDGVCGDEWCVVNHQLTSALNATRPPCHSERRERFDAADDSREEAGSNPLAIADPDILVCLVQLLDR